MDEPDEKRLEEARQRRARASWWALGAASLLLAPFVYVGAKNALPFFFGGEALRGVSIVGGRGPDLAMPASKSSGPPKTESALSSLSAPAAEPEPALEALPLAKDEEDDDDDEDDDGAAPAPTAAQPATAPKAPAQPQTRYPKLKSTRGFKTLWTPPDRRGTVINYGPTPGQDQKAGPPPETPPSPVAAPSPPADQTMAAAPAPKAAPAPAAPKTIKHRNPGAPIASGGGGGTVIGPPAKTSVIENAPPSMVFGNVQTAAPGAQSGQVIRGPADALPPPSPEAPRLAGGPCPKKGWWKNDTTGLCYPGRDSCLAANHRRGRCEQPNP